jgi:putative transposase
MMTMGYHPRIETSNIATFQTTRSRNSELWFVNNKPLEDAVLGLLAKFASRYSVELYAFAIEGNHTQFPALFPNCNRAHFMRDLNSNIARAVTRYSPSYPGGRFWGRRYSAEFLPGNEDIEEWLFYTALQPILDGHVQKLSEYPGYNCFHDAVHEITRTFKVMNWAAYNEKKKWCKNVRKKDFIEEVNLTYKRLPGYESMGKKEYIKMMYDKLEKRRAEILEKRRVEGRPCKNGQHLRAIRQGSLPRGTKVSDRYTHRPRVLCVCNERRAKAKAWYFEWYFCFKEASLLYRTKNPRAKFPPGTYKPPKFTCRYKVNAEYF